MNYKIRTLLVGTLTADVHTLVMIAPDAGKKLRVPIFSFYIEGGGVKVLFDTGGPPAEQLDKILGAGKYGSLPASGGGGNDGVTKALADIGVQPSDITIVVVSHLHVDHAWNLDIFPNAKLILQRDEVIDAIDSPPPTRFGYSRTLNLKVIGRKQPEHLLIVDGDLEIAEGINLIKTPGHTLGCQSIIVQTVKGRVAITQAGPTYANWFPVDARLGIPLNFLIGTYNPDGIATEGLRICLKSMDRVVTAADIIMPIHDWRIPKLIPEQWWFAPQDELCTVDWDKLPFKYGIVG